MKLTVKDMDIATGDVLVVILNEKDAERLDLHHTDRVLVRKGRKSTVAILDIAESEKAIPVGTVGLFEEVLDAINAVDGDVVELLPAKKPISVNYIKKKLDGYELSYDEIYSIMKDVVDNKLTTIELTSYITANYVHEMSNREISSLTRAMVETGTRLKFKTDIAADLHCIGGVPGNRTTLVVVPILVAAGLCVPKTASRAITSPAGTADTMEVLCSVSLPVQKLKRIAETVGGFIVWGGAINLAPADDKIIDIEYPLSIDARGQMLASIMAKKASVSATHLLVDIPIGPETKTRNMKEALHLDWHFRELGKELGIKTFTMITDGSEPIGNGIGPVLEARDCLWVLQNDPRGPEDLKQKSLEMAAQLLEFTGKVKKGKGRELAEMLLANGSAYKTMVRIIKAQNGKHFNPDELKPASYSYSYRAEKSGKIVSISNSVIAKTARLAGAPHDKGAGIYLFKHKGDYVKKGEVLFNVYSVNNDTLKQAVLMLREKRGVEIR